MHSRLVRRTMTLFLMLLPLAGAACGGGDDGAGPGTGGGSTSAVDVRDNSFSPNSVNVTVGTSVRWTWRGIGLHDVVFADGVQSAQQTTGTYARQFTTAGTYQYLCSIHGSAMSGRVVVQ